ncbi:MAG: TlpA family protein disulfide reductase [Pseudomonadota bacterium]
MNDKPFLSPNWVGAYLVAIALALLFWLEPLLKNRARKFVQSDALHHSQSIIPLNHSLGIISFGNLQRLSTGKSTSLEQILNEEGRSRRVLLVNFWATWCEPCIEEIPTLGLLSEQLGNQSDTSLPLIITISVDESAEAVLKFEKTLGRNLPFVVLHDPDGALSRSLGVTKFPETFLINSSGNVLHKWIGPQDWLSFEILEILKKSCA